MPAPKNNKFAIGNSGKAKRWETPEELELEIEEYFSSCNNHTREVYDKKAGKTAKISSPLPYTIEGLCEVLDCERQTLLNYEKQKGYEEYFDTIKRAKRKIARNKLERGLTGQSVSNVTIFDLKNNHGYKDKMEFDQTIEDKSIDRSKLTNEELRQLSEINKAVARRRANHDSSS